MVVGVGSEGGDPSRLVFGAVVELEPVGVVGGPAGLERADLGDRGARAGGG